MKVQHAKQAPKFHKFMGKSWPHTAASNYLYLFSVGEFLHVYFSFQTVVL